MAETTPKFVYNSITVELDYPLATNDPYRVVTDKTEQFSLSGKKQTAFNYNEEIKDIDIQFASESTKDALITMYKDWASEGRTIAFYPDKDSASFDSVTIDANSFTVTRQATGTSVFQVRFNIRKVL